MLVYNVHTHTKTFALPYKGVYADRLPQPLPPSPHSPLPRIR